MEWCLRRREGSLVQGREGIEAKATCMRERSGSTMGLSKDQSLDVSPRKLGSLPLSLPLQKILLLPRSRRRLLGPGPDNGRWDTLIRSNTRRMSPAKKAGYLRGGGYLMGTSSS